LPLREPVLLAKQVATLDQLSNGRVTLGVAVGGYRDEFEAVRPDAAGANRADLTREIIESVRALWEQPRTSYRGKYVHFEDVESFPKPVQDPLPIYSGGNVEGSLRRAAELCQGWLPAKIGPAKIAEGRAKIARYVQAAGREPDTITTALQSVVCIGNTEEQARETFFNSSFDLFRKSLQSTMTKGVDVDAYLAMNLVGSIDQIVEKVGAYQSAGLSHLTALLFVGNTVEDMREQMRMMARHVLPLFPDVQ
jgi:alkanesulfonate monooxygenase SsuD/methylene tetrahydromethanopterin reductase-like flavin-dependent oxidoreductase (luciferase family)